MSKMKINVHESADIGQEIIRIIREHGFEINEDDSLDADAVIAYKEFRTHIQQYLGRITPENATKALGVAERTVPMYLSALQTIQRAL